MELCLTPSRVNVLDVVVVRPTAPQALFKKLTILSGLIRVFVITVRECIVFLNVWQFAPPTMAAFLISKSFGAAGLLNTIAWFQGFAPQNKQSIGSNGLTDIPSELQPKSTRGK